MAIIQRHAAFQNLSNFQTFIKDENPLSEYFRITEINNTLTGGKNGFLIEGTPHLKETTEIKLEILDVNGIPIYLEPGDGSPVEYYEGTSVLVSVHIYPDTPIGIGKLIVLGEAKTYVDEFGATVPIPKEWSDIYNIKWEKEFKINRSLLNEDKVRFYERPLISITEIAKPIFTVEIPNIVQTGSLIGIPEFPEEGVDLSKWNAGTRYKLRITDDTNWSSSIDEDIINIPSLNYSTLVREVVNAKDVLVETPFTIDNIVQPFTTSSYTASFEYIESQILTPSALTGSYANIKISKLKTFVGDVARVKIFRKSRNNVSDFQFIQEAKIESVELLKDLTVTSSNEVRYGLFTEDVLETYWITSSADHPVSIDSAKLQQAVFIDYNTGAGGTQRLETVNSITASKDLEYTLSFKALLNGEPNDTKSLKAYLSSSDFQQTFIEISGSSDFLERVKIDKNIIISDFSSSENTSQAHLVFEFTGDDWYISNVSLRNAEETSFSPDEFSLIQEIPRQLPVEIFDFRFDFYDINNNYIPVLVTATGSFDGGNTSDSDRLTKFLTFESDRTAFRFTTGSIGNPEFQQIGFKITKNLVSGSITYASSAFDENGDYLTSASYAGGQYPGFLTNASDNGGTVTIGNFTGSDSAITVGSIVYTASIEDLEEFETIFRFEDALTVSTLIASSDANNFFYEPTELALRPTPQTITIQVERFNLDSNFTPITVTSGSGKPPLTTISDINGKKIYQLYGVNYANSVGDTTYGFSAVDEFGGVRTSEITVTPLINFDGISVNLSNENTSFPSLSTGFVESASMDDGDGFVFVNAGLTAIDHQNGLSSNNRFDIIGATGSNCTPNSVAPTTNNYGISAMTADSASLELSIRYKAGNGDTIDIQKFVNYSKAKNAVPNIIVYGDPLTQTIPSNSVGSGSTIPIDITVFADEGNTDVFTSIGTLGLTNGIAATGVGNEVLITSNASDMTLDSGSITIPVNYTDSEGTNGTTTITATISRVRSAGPNVLIEINPQAQTVTSNAAFTSVGTPNNALVIVGEGDSDYTYNAGLSSNQFYITNVTGGTNSSATIIPTVPTDATGTSGVVTISYRNSEGTLFTGKTINFYVGVAVVGEDGGTGNTGPGIIHTGVWEPNHVYQFTAGTIPGTARRDTVFWSTSGNQPYDTYYGSLAQHTSAASAGDNTATGAPHQSNSVVWESLGTEDLFVAAKIGIFRESYIHNTLNIGTTTTGSYSSANITLAGGTNNPYISIGQSTAGVYAADGIFIGNDGGDYKLSLTGGSNYIKWNGSALDISGSISASEGQIGGWILDDYTLLSDPVKSTNLELNSGGGPDEPFIEFGPSIGSGGRYTLQKLLPAYSDTISTSTLTSAVKSSLNYYTKVYTTSVATETITFTTSTAEAVEISDSINSLSMTFANAKAIMSGPGNKFVPRANITKDSGTVNSCSIIESYWIVQESVSAFYTKWGANGYEFCRVRYDQDLYPTLLFLRGMPGENSGGTEKTFKIEQRFKVSSTFLDVVDPTTLVYRSWTRLNDSNGGTNNTYSGIVGNDFGLTNAVNSTEGYRHWITGQYKKIEINTSDVAGAGSFDAPFDIIGNIRVEGSIELNGTFEVEGGIDIRSGLNVDETIYGGNDLHLVGDGYANDWIGTSDKRKKHGITILKSKKLNTVYKSFIFNNDDNNKIRIGLIAQDLLLTHPEFVRGNGEVGYSISYIDLHSAEISYLKSENKRLSELINKIIEKINL